MSYEELTDLATIFTRKETANLPMSVKDGQVVICIVEADLTALLIEFATVTTTEVKTTT